MLKTTIKYTNNFHSKELQNTPKTWIFGTKIYHPATLLVICALAARSKGPSDQKIMSSSPARCLSIAMMLFVT
jgi:hypothetical protein